MNNPNSPKSEDRTGQLENKLGSMAIATSEKLPQEETKLRRSEEKKSALTYRMSEAKGFSEAMYAIRVNERMKREIKDPLPWDNFQQSINPVEGKFYLTRWVTERAWDEYEGTTNDEDYVEWYTTGVHAGDQDYNKRKYDGGIGAFSLEFDSAEEAAIFAEKTVDEAQGAFDAWGMSERGSYSPFTLGAKYNNTLSGNYEEIFLDVRDSNGEVVYESTMAVNEAQLDMIASM